MDNFSLARRLNQGCEWVSSNPSLIAQISGTPREEHSWQKMLSKHPVFVEQHHIETMTALIKAITLLSQNTAYQSLIKPVIPHIASHVSPSSGVLFGYDFHLTESGPKLIEVNTNAGGAYFNHFLNQSQQACCNTSSVLMNSPFWEATGFESHLLKMFVDEYALSHPGRDLETIAIVDQRPEEQFLYPEFCLFRKLFEQAGIETFIVDPGALTYDGKKIRYKQKIIDLIYNRHTDFYLNSASLASIKAAYLNNQVVLTPNPHTYGLAADKRLMSFWTDPLFLDQLELDASTKALLLESIPLTRIVTPENSDDLWNKRKQLFFKPLTGFGSRASYRGAKLTRKTWQYILDSNHYIAQQFIAPSTREFNHEGEIKTFKMDLRHYVYSGKSLMLSARLYRGQATNMNTAGGGFATVYGIRTPFK